MFVKIYIYITFSVLLDDKNIASVMDKLMSVEHWWNNSDSGKPKYSEKKCCLNATVSNINVTWTGLRLNLALRVKKPVTNSLKHGTTKIHNSTTP